MVIGGFIKFSLNDYPDKTSAVIFTRGCNFRCGYCHNPELVLPDKYTSEISLDYIYSFLKNRKGKLDAVCITGGEPIQHPDLPEVLKKIKEMGFLAKIDTNGSMPEALELIIKSGHVDYIAMDVKAPFEDYKKIIGTSIHPQKIKKSINLIINSGIPHEFRTTVVKSLTSLDDLRKIAKSIKGAENYFIQRFIPAVKLNNPRFQNEVSYSEKELKKLAAELTAFVKHCGVR